MTAQRASTTVSEPPRRLPPGKLVHVRGRGELFVRDTGEDARPAVLLLHGWMFSSDLNWHTTYDAVHAAGYRVLAVDHRGHGRGLRAPVPFRLQDCADDAAAVLGALGVPAAIVVGYSLGGAVAQLMGRDHPATVRAIVLCATASRWSGLKMRAVWSTMAGLRLALGLAPNALWRYGLRLSGSPDTPTTAWLATELSRGSAVDLAEAGRELGRFDARPWQRDLAMPVAVVVTRDDTSVPPAEQRAQAAHLGAPVFEAPGSHSAVTLRSAEFNETLLRALAAVDDDPPTAPGPVGRGRPAAATAP